MSGKRGSARRKFYCLVTGVFSLLLPSCTHKQKQNKHKKSVITVDLQDVDQQKSVILEKVIDQEALLANIPIPLYDKRILPDSLDFFERDTIVLGYSSPLDKQFLIDFFMNQMERYGWRHLVSFNNKRTQLFFENPDSYCLVEIKAPEKYGVSFFIYVKRANQEGSLIGNELG